MLRSGQGGLAIQPADALLLAAMACAAVGYGWGARLSQRMRAEHVICWALVIALPLTLPAALLTRPQQALQAAAWWGFAYVAVFSMWLGFFAWYRGLALGGTVRVSQVQLVQPFLGMLFAVPLLGESLDAVTLGFAVAVIATVFSARKCPYAPPREPPLTPSEKPMKPNDLQHTHWVLARRAEKMNPSVIREILKVTERPGIISFAGGLPSPKTFPVSEFAAACEKVLRRRRPRRAAIRRQRRLCARCARWSPRMLPWKVDPAQVLITTGSQQGLDLVAKVLIDAGSRILVETPTYLGALQAFSPMEPEVVSVASDDEGVDIDDLADKAQVRALPLRAAQLPEPDRPHHDRSAPRRAFAPRRRTGPAHRRGQPLRRPVVRRPAAAAADRAQPRRLRLPGLLLQGAGARPAAGLPGGARKSLYPKLLQAKQAADLHSPSFNQRMVAEVMKDGFLDRHVPTIRALYKSQRDAMLARATTRDARPGRAMEHARRRHVPVGAPARKA